MDWTIHPDGGMWMNCIVFTHVSHVQVWRDMLSGMWIGYIAPRGTGRKDFWSRSMDFGEVITELEATIILLEVS